MEASSLEERRQQLNTEFQKSGIANQIKAKIRSEILQELKKRHDSAVTELGKKPSVEPGVVEHMIAQYLQQHGYHYSLSIYAAESGVETTPAPTPMETMRVLGLNGWPKFVQIVSDSLSNNPSQGLLLTLLDSIGTFLNSVSESTGNDEATQRYLKQLEGSYIEAIHSFQREAQEVKQRRTEHVEQEVNQRMQQFRHEESEEIKRREAEHWEKQMINHKRHLEDAYEARVQALREKEACMTEEMNRQRVEMERLAQHHQEELNKGDQYLRERQWSLERGLAERQGCIERIEQQLRQREEGRVKAERELHDRMMAWTTKEKQCELQAHFRAQQHLSAEHESILQAQQTLQADWAKLEREKQEMRSQMDCQRREMEEMEAAMKRSQAKAIQLKENESVLTQRLQRMQSELMEFQKALLKSHHIPIDTPLLQQPSGRVENRIQLVRELLSQVNRSHDSVAVLKGKLREQSKKRHEACRAAKRLRQELGDLREKCSSLQSLAAEAVKESEHAIGKLSDARKLLTATENENSALRIKLDAVQHLNLAQRDQQREQPVIETKHTVDALSEPLDGTENSFVRIRRNQEFEALEQQERELLSRLTTFKEKLKGDPIARPRPRHSMASPVRDGGCWSELSDGVGSVTVTESEATDLPVSLTGRKSTDQREEASSRTLQRNAAQLLELVQEPETVTRSLEPALPSRQEPPTPLALTSSAEILLPELPPPSAAANANPVPPSSSGVYPQDPSQLAVPSDLFDSNPFIRAGTYTPAPVERTPAHLVFGSTPMLEYEGAEGNAIGMEGVPALPLPAKFADLFVADVSPSLPFRTAPSAPSGAEREPNPPQPAPVVEVDRETESEREEETEYVDDFESDNNDAENAEAKQESVRAELPALQPTAKSTDSDGDPLGREPEIEAANDASDASSCPNTDSEESSIPPDLDDFTDSSHPSS